MSSASSVFSFIRPIAGGTVGQPFKVMVQNPPPSVKSSGKSEQKEKGGVQGEVVEVNEDCVVIDREIVSTAPKTAENADALVPQHKVLLMNKKGQRMRLGKPKHKFNGKELVEKDRIFDDVLTMPKINRHPSDNATYRLTRMVRTDGFLASSTTLDTTGSLTFLLSALPGISDCTSLFDAYRVLAIECWIIPRFQTNTDRAYNPGILATAVDYDGGTATYDELSQYPNVMMGTGLAGHYRSWAPGVIILTPGPSSAGLVISPWLDCADTGVAHHGLNYGITPTSLVQTYDRVTRFHLEFKRVR